MNEFDIDARKALIGLAIIAVIGFGFFEWVSAPSDTTPVGNEEVDPLPQQVSLMEQQLIDLQTRVQDLENIHAPETAEGDNGEPPEADDGTQEDSEASNATAEATAVVATDYLNVRPEPTSDNPRIGVLKEGTTVTVLGEQDNWTQIRFADLTGWVSTEYLKPTGGE